MSASNPTVDGTCVNITGLELLDLVLRGFFFGTEAIVVMDNMGGLTLFLYKYGCDSTEPTIPELFMMSSEVLLFHRFHDSLTL